MRTVHVILVAAIFLAISAIAFHDMAQEMYAASHRAKIQEGGEY